MWRLRCGSRSAVWALGVGGLFGYHALYFMALRLAPPAEAQLVNYLWPLLIVLFAALLPGERLRAHHIVGTLIGLLGTVLLLVDRGGISFAQDYLAGFAAALVSRVRLGGLLGAVAADLRPYPTAAVAGFCLATAALSGLCHVAVRGRRMWPAGATQWLAVMALGIGPVGAAFYAWDVGVKRGDIRVLGAASYAAPLLSTAYLVLAGYATASSGARARRALDRGWRLDRRQGHDPRAEEALAGLPIGRRQIEACKLETRRHRAADQRPVAETFRRLPGMRRHDRLWPLAGREIGAQREPLDRSPLMRRRSRARAARPRGSARPRPHRPGASASARRAPAGNRSRSRPDVRQATGGCHGTSGGNVRPRDAA